MNTSRFFGGAARAVVVLSVVGLSAACGGSGSDSSGGGDGSSDGGTSSDQLTAAQELVDSVSGGPGTQQFPAPTDAVDPGKRKVAVIAAGMAGASGTQVAPQVLDAIKTIGWDTDAPGDGKFDATVQSGLVQQAVQAKVDGIVLISITPSTLSTAVNAATAADIPIVCVNCGGPDPDEEGAPGVIHADPSTKQIGEVQAAYAMTLTEGTGNIFLFNDPVYTAGQAAAAESYLEENCPGCKVGDVTNMAIKDAVAPGAPLFTAFMSSHPKGTVDVVVAPYDTAAEPFAVAAEQAGRTDIKIVSYSGTQTFYEQIAAKSPANAMGTVTVALPYESWAAVDLLARMLAGAELWDASALPVALITQDNASKFDPAAPNAAPEGDFRAMFKELWSTN